MVLQLEKRKKERKKEKNSISFCFDDRASVVRLMQTTTTATTTKGFQKNTTKAVFSCHLKHEICLIISRTCCSMKSIFSLLV